MDYCENSLNQQSADSDRSSDLPRLQYRRLGLAYRPTISSMPRHYNTTEETVEDLNLKKARARQQCAHQVQAFLRRRHKSMYKPSPLEYSRSSLVTPDSG